MIEWWSKKSSSYFPIPSSDFDVNTTLKINFGLNKHNDIYNSNYLFNDLTLNDLFFDDLKTKKNKSIKNIDRTTKSLKIFIYPNEEQINILNDWFKECIKVYNFCINKYNNNKKYFDKMDRSDKIKIFNDLYGNNNKNTPYDILSDEVRIFFSNLKSSQTNLKNKNIKTFELKSKDVSKSHSIFIPKTSIKNDGFYTRYLKNMKGMENNNINLSDIGDSRLIHDKLNKQYYLSIPYYKKITKLKNLIRVVSIDPGEKIFISFFSEINYGHIGKNIRNKILPIEKKIRRYQSILSNKMNSNKKINGKRLIYNKLDKIKEKYIKKGKKFNIILSRSNSILKNRKHLKIRIKKYYKKIKNIVKELHNKSALYLVKNYERILLPKFETQNMIINKKYNKDYFNKIKTEKGKDESIKEIKEVYKKRRLNGRVKFVLNNLSHYKFKLHLLNKCKEYGSELIEVSEEYTSKTCTVCGIQSVKYSKERIKECKCGYHIDRDINGARNILIKNFKKVVRPWDTIHPKECTKLVL